MITIAWPAFLAAVVIYMVTKKKWKLSSVVVSACLTLGISQYSAVRPALDSVNRVGSEVSADLGNAWNGLWADGDGAALGGGGPAALGAPGGEG